MRKPLTETHPQLSKEWHYKKNAPLKPNQVSYGMERKVWWKCKKKGHEWQARLYHRTSRGQGCPYCAGQKIGKDNNLQILYPKLVKEWHPIKNKTFLPNQIAPGSDKKYWWKCLKGHEWQTSPNNRTSPGNLNDCPFCTKQTSRPEARIFAELVTLFPDSFRRKKVYNQELDIFISNYKIGIEFDGFYYHKNKLAKDKEKNTKLAKHNIKIVRIRQHPLKKISTSDIIYKDSVIFVSYAENRSNRMSSTSVARAELNTKKLIKAIKLVLLGLSEHYTLECMPLTNERIEWAISFRKAGLCDIFCWRGANEFNESQKNNLLKLIQYTNQDCFTFEAAQSLSDGQIDIMIENKKENMLDYYAMVAASEYKET